MNIYLLPIVCGTVLALFSFKENVLLQLAVLPALLGLLVSFLMALTRAIRHWQIHRWRIVLPFIVVALCGYGGPRLGRIVRNTYFRTIIPRLEVAIDSYRSTGTLPDVQWRGYLARAHEWNNTTIATFWWGGGFPVKHTVLLYCSGDDITDYRKENGWYYAYPLKEHWWIVKD